MIVPHAENFWGDGGLKIPSIGALYIGTVLSKYHDVKIYDGNITKFSKNGKLNREVLEADAFGISLMTPSSGLGYRYIKQIKEKRPGARIVIGGPHTMGLAEEALNYTNADYVVKGDGELIVREAFEGNPVERIIQEELSNLNELPFPDFSLLQNPGKITFSPILTSRGCPYTCEFCQVSGNYRYRDSNDVFKELQERNAQGQRDIFFTDDLFGLRKDDAVPFLEEMIMEGINFKRISVETRADIINRHSDLVELLGRVSESSVHLGIESAGQKVLDSYNKRQKVEDIVKAIETLNRQKIKVNGMFILGADTEDQTTIEETHEFLRQNKLDSTTFSTLYPIPGTKLFERLNNEGRILTKDWSLYDGMHVVSKPKNLTPMELQKAWIDTWKTAYPIDIQEGFSQKNLRSYWVNLLIKSWESRNKKHFEDLELWSKR